MLIFERWIIIIYLIDNNVDQTQPNKKEKDMSNLTDAQKLQKYEEMIAQRRKHTERRLAKINVILRKAELAGITASESEIDEEVRRPKRK